MEGQAHQKFQPAPLYEDLAERLRVKFYNELREMPDVSKILFLTNTEDTPTDDGDTLYMKASAIKDPFAYLLDKDWLVLIFQANIGSLSMERVTLELYHALRQIKGDKIKKPGVRMHREMIDTPGIGADWRREHRALPNVLEDAFQFKHTPEQMTLFRWFEEQELQANQAATARETAARDSNWNVRPLRPQQGAQ